MDRDYNAAVAKLNTLQSNFQIVNAIRKSGRSLNQNAIPEMIEWCRKIGYEPHEFDKINSIHVAGTKGKGSTSAMVSSILSQYNTKGVSKIGLFTSPHLRFVRERIQINNIPITEEQFAEHFFQLWDKFESAAEKEGHPNPQDPSTKPNYFRYLTLMAFHIYLKEQVDSAVIECGIGGEYDSTNILVKPSATGIASLGIDHTSMLGDTLESIAWHKSGIFKPNIPAYTVPQPPSALQVLQERAQERNAPLTVVERHPDLSTLKLGLDADFQLTNASLAIHLAASFLHHTGQLRGVPSPQTINSVPLPAEFRAGLEQVRWPGRCEIRHEQGLSWYIDGGHTTDSIAYTGAWFASRITTHSEISSSSAESKKSSKRVLIFNQQTRSTAAALLSLLHKTISSSLDGAQPFTHVVFCTNTTFVDKGFSPDLVSLNTDSKAVGELSVQRGLAEAWGEIDPRAEVEVVRSIEEAVGVARGLLGSKDGEEGREVEVLVTGSLHLVGGLIDVLETEKGVS